MEHVDGLPCFALNAGPSLFQVPQVTLRVQTTNVVMLALPTSK